MIAIKVKNGLNPICWQSKKLVVPTRSPLASEASAASDDADAADFIRSQIQELFPAIKVNISCNKDSKSLVKTVQTTKVYNDKHLVVDIALIKEMIEDKEIFFKWISGKEQLAN